MPPPDHAVRLRDGDREIEVSGNPAFVRQVLDDLPTLMARLRGETPGRTTISMPAPPSPSPGPTAAASPALVDGFPAPVGGQPSDEVGSSGGIENGTGNGTQRKRAGSAEATASLEDRIFQVLRGSGRPLAIAAIRQRLDGPDVTGQQVRRLLERAGSRVTVSADRPATYSLH